MRIFFFWKMWVLVAWILVMEIDELKFCVAESQKLRQSPNVEKCKAALSPSIKNIINEAGFGTFFEALLNHETHEYKDLQLLLALAERFWDTTCTFHFPKKELKKRSD